MGIQNSFGYSNGFANLFAICRALAIRNCKAINNSIAVANCDEQSYLCTKISRCP